MKKLLTMCIAAVFAVSLLAAGSYLIAKDTQTKTGWITDTMCKEHATKGKDKTCVLMCVKEHGAKYAFYDNDSKVVFEIDDQKKVETFAGEDVELKGVFDADKKIVKLVSIKKVEKT